ncbi:MAG: hypothetical protein V4594_04595 [Bacteroidota bacterium]
MEEPILHAINEIGGTTVTGADIPGAKPMRSAYQRAHQIICRKLQRST